jgi:hypothetical protein
MLFRWILFAVIVFVSACGHEHEEKKYVDYQRIKKLTEKSTLRFNPGFINGRHTILVYKIDNYEIFDSMRIVRGQPVRYTKTVLGKMPSMRSGGSFEVIIHYTGDKRDLQSAKDSITSYRMLSPLYHRVEQGADRGLVKIKAGTFEIPLPDIRNIRKITLKDYGREKHVSIFN